VFPALGGRVQRIAGVFPRLMRWAIPRAEARGVRRRQELIADAHAPDPNSRREPVA
jgi:hypothetical protein